MATRSESPFPTSSTAGDDNFGSTGTSSSTGLGGSGVSGLTEGGMPSSAGDDGLSPMSGGLDGGSTSTGGGRGTDMLQRVVQGAHQTIDRLADSAAPHVQRFSEGLDQKSGQVRDMSDEWTESLRSTVRENPIAAVATALAVGMLISRLTR